ncbi:SAM-dependent chlorinase/fluorinase [Thiohalophilus sp.]|uniref:SAM hydrolase/SAM-dependent halogenase family protein n=1 Tax=Thiohalophilus sp. TaxID=3028392 RepID=UPI002ACE222E|nr:SAM-dependent chlorinase/fluorinase [Thiohalophilus sp.]MDZ7661292.1 SAM-dependent chlorinase/fluorinase [Thiohalophilus sp.]
MIVLFTDFGYEGPYVGQMKGVLARHAPNVPVIDLMHDAPVFNPRAAAYLLAALCEPFPEQAVFVSVVDPGVGHPHRRPVIVRADNRWFVGPANMLFNTVIKLAGEVEVWEITWRPPQLSDSFHGRDLFAPVAAQLALGRMPEAEQISVTDLLSLDWPSDLYEIIYFDHYGNAMTGIRADALSSDQQLLIGEQKLYYARTFSLAEKGRPFWYRNSSGLVELAMDSDSIREHLRLQIGETIKLADED